MHRRRTLLSGASDWYVTDGLAHMYDGILNTRSGHNASTETWEDLVDDTGGYDFPITSQQTINPDNIYLRNGLTSPSSFVSPVRPKMVEIVLKKASTVNGYQAMHPWQGFYSTIDKNVYRFTTASNIGIKITNFSNTIVAFSYRNDTDSSTHLPLINGIFCDNFSSSSDSWGTSSAYRMFCQKSATSYPLVGNVYSVRIYTRYLTDAERLHNFEVDKKRFGIMGGADWEDGIPYSNLDVVEGAYVEASTGTFKLDDTWSRTKFIPCYGVSTMTFPPVPQTYGQTADSNHFYDGAKNPISLCANLSKTNYTTISVPAGAAYFAISSETDALESCLNAGIVPHK